MSRRKHFQTPVDEAFSSKIRPFIDVIDDLRKLGLNRDIQLPSVVVVGDQSSGKSSIIEAISGIQLPRGKGIVTRCPLELQLKRINKDQPWKAMLTARNESIAILDPGQIEKLVSNAQINICGKGSNVSEELLTLKIESPKENASDLTLIDLPGITRLAVDAQSRKNCDDIRRIIDTYAKSENTIILCVISANLDLNVNEALTVATKFDPQGKRTIGILTKPDLVIEEGKPDVKKSAENKNIKLKKGFIMVKCRSQGDLEKNISLDEALKKETEFFLNDEYFRDLDPSLWGTVTLAKKISEELYHVIKGNIPKLKDRIDECLEETKVALKHIPLGIPEDIGDRQLYLIKIINNVSNMINKFLRTGEVTETGRNTRTFCEWRKLCHEFQSEIQRKQDDAFFNGFNSNKVLEFSATEVEKKILEYRGREVPGFPNYSVFEELAQNHVKLYEQPAKQLLNSMKDATEKGLKSIINSHLKHVERVERKILAHALVVLNEKSNKALEQIEFILKGEKMIYTNDKLFNKEKENLEKSGASARFHSEWTIQMIQKSLHCYLTIVQSRICDTVPIAIRQCIHFDLSDYLKDHLLTSAKEIDFTNDVVEDNQMSSNRKRLTQKIDRLHEAKQKLALFS